MNAGRSFIYSNIDGFFAKKRRDCCQYLVHVRIMTILTSIDRLEILVSEDKLVLLKI